MKLTTLNTTDYPGVANALNAIDIGDRYTNTLIAIEGLATGNATIKAKVVGSTFATTLGVINLANVRHLVISELPVDALEITTDVVAATAYTAFVTQW